MNLDSLLGALRAAAEPTRLRLLALCASGELTVTELTQILGQSQPRVSRHLKLLCEANLLDRFREGTWVFYRLSETGRAAGLSSQLVRHLPPDDPTLKRDRERLTAVKEARARSAAEYFRANADQWDEIRALHVPEEDVEKALVDAFKDDSVDVLLDVGTGTGRILEVLSDRCKRGIGVDASRDMLAIARTDLERNGIKHCQVRHGDMYSLPMENDSVDAVTFHQVLHYADDPAAAIAEAGRVLKHGGRLVVVDFLPHELEYLRTDHAHRRLGFADSEVKAWFKASGLNSETSEHLKGEPLTVGIWPAVKNGNGAGNGRLSV